MPRNLSICAPFVSHFFSFALHLFTRFIYVLCSGCRHLFSVLYDIPLYKYATIYESFLLVVNSCRFKFLFANSAAINILLHVFSIPDIGNRTDILINLHVPASSFWPLHLDVVSKMKNKNMKCTVFVLCLSLVLLVGRIR